MEIERRFLFKENIDIDHIVEHLPSKSIKQGYLFVNTDEASCARVRIIDTISYLTLKKKVTSYSAEEFEYEIPVHDAHHMLATMVHGYIIEKTRYYYHSDGLIFEIDVFDGVNRGLSLIEVELPSEEYPVLLPPWVGEEITGDDNYMNAMLSITPFTKWGRGTSPHSL